MREKGIFAEKSHQTNFNFSNNQITIHSLIRLKFGGHLKVLFFFILNGGDGFWTAGFLVFMVQKLLFMTILQ